MKKGMIIFILFLALVFPMCPVYAAAASDYAEIIKQTEEDGAEESEDEDSDDEEYDDEDSDDEEYDDEDSDDEEYEDEDSDDEEYEDEDSDDEEYDDEDSDDEEYDDEDSDDEEYEDEDSDDEDSDDEEYEDDDEYIYETTIIFDANGGKGKMSELTLYSDSEEEILTSNEFKRTGFTFDSWNTKADGSGVRYENEEDVTKLAQEATNDTEIRLYAQWKINPTIIVFNANGGKGKMSELTLNSDSKKEILTANKFKRTGFVFIGWNTKANGSGVSYEDKQDVTKLAQEVKKDSKITLYAQWKLNATSIKSLKWNAENKITVSFKKNSAASGYQIQYAKSSKFTSAKTVVVDKKKSSKEISKLDPGKRYYVRVRCYYTEKGKKTYSDWSSASNIIMKLNAPKITSVKEISSKTKTKTLTVKFQKNSKANGYEVQYSTSKGFKKTTKNLAVNKKNSSLKISKLSAGKTYYVRIRAYSVVDGKKVYSDWSSASKVKLSKK